jgi:hypothetical protein
MAVFGKRLPAGLEPRRADRGPQVHDPAERNHPKDGRHHEMHQRSEYPALNELTESGYEKAAEGSDDVSGGSLA